MLPNKFVKADAHNLPFKDKSFDIAVCFEVLEHCKRPELVLQEIARCTKNILIMSVPDCDLNNKLRKYDLALAHWTDPTHCNFFTKESICKLLVKHNFKIIHVGGCYKIHTGDYFWNSIKLPLLVRKIGARATRKLRLFEEYFSSILIISTLCK